MNQTAARLHDPDVAHLIGSVEAAVLASAVTGSEAERAARRVFARCRSAVGAPGPATGVRLPASALLGEAAALPRSGARDAVARSLLALADRLTWVRSLSAEQADAAFRDGHANTIIVGPGGIEDRDDVWIGATVIAPGVTYPEHRHPPEEVYLALTPGEWWNADVDWTDPEPDGLIYNPPGIRHAMRACATPFLALWLLPL